MLFPRPVGPTDIVSPWGPEQIGPAATPRPHQGQVSRIGYVDPVPPFPFEAAQAFIAYPRLPTLDRRGWSAIQPTPVDAPFSEEMVAGASSMPRPHLGKGLFSWMQPDPITFPFESTYGWRVLPVLPKLDRTGWSVIQPQPVAAPFSEEMVAGASVSPRPHQGRGWFSWMITDTLIFTGFSITVRDFQGKTSTQTIAKKAGLYVIGPPQFTIQNFVSTIKSIVLSGVHQGLYIREQEPNISADGNPWFRWEEDQPLIGITDPTTYKAGVF